MTFFTFSDPLVAFQLICTVPITLVTLYLVTFERHESPAFTFLAVSISCGMWALVLLFESFNHTQTGWAFEAGFYLLGAAMAYFAWRALRSFLRKFDRGA